MIEKLRISKRMWTVIHIALILWVGWMAAGLIDRTIAGSVEKMAENGAGLRIAPVKPVSIQPSGDYSLILNQNIFNSSARPGPPPSTAPRGPAVARPAPPSQLDNAPQTSLNLKLVGTVMDDAGVLRFAAIEIIDTGDQSLYGLGTTVSGASVVRIERNRVALMNAGRLEVLEVDFSEKKNGAAGRSIKRAAPPISSMAPGREVMKFGEGEFSVSKRYIDAQLQNMSQLLTEVRAVPNMDKNGVTNGFKLFAIKKGSMFSKIGLQNHDVIQRVNGIELNSAEKGLELFQALRNETNFTLDLLRRSRKTTLRLAVQ